VKSDFRTSGLPDAEDAKVSQRTQKESHESSFKPSLDSFASSASFCALCVRLSAPAFLNPMPQPTAIVIEDEPQIRRFVRGALEAEGWVVHDAGTLRDGLAAAGTRQPDLLVLDLGLPDGDGVTLIRDVRGWSTVPIIVLSARIDEADKIAALDAGADDYLTKPFGTGELLARVRANLRRPRAVAGDDGSNSNHGEPVFRFGDVEVDRAARLVRRAGAEVHLTPTEYRLLTVLAGNAGRVLTHRQLLREVWGPSHADQSHYLRVYMGQLRQKLEADAAQPKHLLTETAVGYRLVI